MAVVGVSALLLAVGVLTRPGRRLRRGGASARRADPLDLSVLSELLALLRLGVDAGLSLGGATALALDSLADAETSSERRMLEGGGSVIEVLESLAGRGGRSVGLDALVVSARYGLPIGAALERAEADAVAELRRRTETGIRQLPVRLLFPLVLCVLPAFVLVGVAPVVVAALRV